VGQGEGKRRGRNGAGGELRAGGRGKDEETSLENLSNKVTRRTQKPHNTRKIKILLIRPNL